MEQWYRLIWRSLATAWRRRWLLVATAWGVCLLGWAVVSVIPNSYESNARLYVDADAVLTPLLKGLAIDQDTAGQLAIMQQTLLSRPNLEKLIDKTPLNLSVNDPTQRQGLVAQLGATIRVASEAPNLFTISYRNPSPRLAHDVVAALLKIFVERAAGTTRAAMTNAQKFLDGQIAYYVAQLSAAEQRRAAFLRKYMDILPLQSNGGVSRLDGARAAVTNLEWELKNAMARRDVLQQEQNLTPPVISAGMATGSPNTLQAQLAAAEEKLIELRGSYTDRSPDVIAARQLIAALKEAIVRAPKTPPPAAAGGLSMPNPVYAQLKMQMIEADATISTLRAQLDSARQDLARMQTLAQAAPEVEAQYEGLDRDYQVLRRNYEELLARRQASNITQAADTTANKVQLRVVDPPQIPISPVAPNRFLLVSLVLVVGLGAAAGLAVLLAQTDTSIADPGQLRDFDQPVLGVISMIARLRRRHLFYPQAVGITLAVLILIAVYGGLAAEIISNHHRTLL